jgi:hypothetical protein
MRGSTAELGAERVAPNGYHYVKVERDDKAQWVLKHWLVMEEHLGRRLAPDERVRFKTGDRDNLSIDNLELVKKNKANLQRRRAQLMTRIQELQAELALIQEEIDA